ncbi:hypothetical protein [Ornithinimicrobium ciconiae]|nr:hypothetical protein [Ornithinimicrobium ciconiae]
MFSVTPQSLTNEADYRREELRRSWGTSTRRHHKAVKPATPGSGRVALAR